MNTSAISPLHSAPGKMKVSLWSGDFFPGRNETWRLVKERVRNGRNKSSGKALLQRCSRRHQDPLMQEEQIYDYHLRPSSVFLPGGMEGKNVARKSIRFSLIIRNVLSGVINCTA